MDPLLDLTPPEVPETTLVEQLLHYGLLLGAAFQLVCILSLLVLPANSTEPVLFVHGIKKNP
uniref:Protein MANBAL n=1 Tax=Eptatretus burgeri TaxID=7764 RepID=A0A8C4R896_EPTBU